MWCVTEELAHWQQLELVMNSGGRSRRVPDRRRSPQAGTTQRFRPPAEAVVTSSVVEVWASSQAARSAGPRKTSRRKRLGTLQQSTLAALPLEFNLECRAGNWLWALGNPASALAAEALLISDQNRHRAQCCYAAAQILDVVEVVLNGLEGLVVQALAASQDARSSGPVKSSSASARASS